MSGRWECPAGYVTGAQIRALVKKSTVPVDELRKRVSFDLGRYLGRGGSSVPCPHADYRQLRFEAGLAPLDLEDAARAATE